MALANVTLQYQYFADPARGRPIALGSVFVGIVDTDPETPINQLEIFAKQEDGTEVPISQPVSLSAGGVPQLNGSPIRILVDGAHSLKVLNSGGGQVYYLNDSIEGTEITPFGESLISAADADAGRVIMNSMKKVSSASTDNLMTFDSNDEAQDSGISISRVVQIANADGAADALTAAFSPAVTALTNGLEVRVRAKEANLTTTPTIAFDALVAKTIVNKGNQALSADDIAGLGHELQLVYNSTNDNIELLNPSASGIGSGQTWQNVTSSRSVNTDFTNTTGKPIEVKISGTNATSATYTFIVDGETITSVSGSSQILGSAIVPDGSVYRINVSAGVLSPIWRELR